MRRQAVFNDAGHHLGAAPSGNGLDFLPRDLVAGHVKAGRPVSVMEDWRPSFPGLHAFYPSRRHSSRAPALVIDAIRYRGV